jgi:2-beta-glucuronyltransferase
MHFIAQELALRGPTRFFSIGFSLLSQLNEDPRSSLWKRANRLETVAGVDCYLWRTGLHPFNPKLRWLDPMVARWFKSYAAEIPPVLRQWIAESNVVILESGMSVILYDMVRSINPQAYVIYHAADDLSTIGCAPFLRLELSRVSESFDHICLPSPRLLSYFPERSKAYFVPHGLDLSLAEAGAESPYSAGLNAVSVGSMLFDPGFFRIAAAARPDITFHVIGAGARARKLSAPNLVVRGEMPFRETIPYMKWADLGVAPYAGGKVAPYLVDTSLKLKQFGFLGVPAVCPEVAVGGHPGRFGYRPDDSQSILAAIEKALAFGRFAGSPALDWQAVTDRILCPDRFADTAIAG